MAGWPAPVRRVWRARVRKSLRSDGQGAMSEHVLRVVSEQRDPPRLAPTKPEAADAIGMSVDSLERYVMPDVRAVRRGRLVLIPVAELQAWLERNAARVLERAPRLRVAQATRDR